MTGADVAALLVDRGLDPAERLAKSVLFDRALEALRAPAADAWWVPGRLEVFGKHTDYAGGRSLVCAVPRGLAVVARARQDADVQVVAADGSTAFHLYTDAVARRLARNFPDAHQGADIAFASDLPDASGMSSSSALVVGIATALVRIRGLAETVAWRENIPDPLAASGYYACVENGMSFGTLGGDAGVGTHGGSEDHAAIVTAVPGQLSAFAFVPLQLVDRVPVPPDWTFAIATSRTRAEKTRGARDRYNRLSADARALLGLWNDRHRHADSLAQALASAAGAVDTLHALADQAGRPDLHQRLDHFVREDARIPQAVNAFNERDAATLDALSAASQHDADVLLDNQVDETRSLVASARANGALAACSFGAGFGGSVWALVESGRARSFADTWAPGAFVMTPSIPLTHVSANNS